MNIDRYLRVKQISEWTGLSRATIYALEKAGEFPKKIALGERAVAWLESDIKKWIEERKLAVKTGKEAKPGRPPASKKAALSPLDRPPVPKKPKPVNKAPATTSEETAPSVDQADDDWEQEDAMPSEEDVVAARSMLSRNAQKAASTSGIPVKRPSSRIDALKIDTSEIKKTDSATVLVGSKKITKKP